MSDKIKDTITTAVNIASPVTKLIPNKKTIRKVKKGLRKFDNFMQEKFPNATKKLVKFNDKMEAKSDKFNEKADVYMEENFPKIKKFVEGVDKKIKRTFNSKGGRAGLKGGGMSTRGLGRAFKKGGKV